MTAVSRIPVKVIASVDGARRLYVTTANGSVRTGTGKDGPINADYTAGAAVLADGFGNLIVGPVMHEAAHALAMRVAGGDPRALTEPQAPLVLAVALLAMHEALRRTAPAKASSIETGDQTR